MSVRNRGASIRDRLLIKARAEKLDYNQLLTRYALERMIYRLSISAERDRFMLKGALLFDLWFDVPHRPTHDADFLGFGSAEIPHVEAVFRDICRIEVDDGIVFDPDSVNAAEIRKEATYAGVRVMLVGMLDKARCSVQADIGFGDAVVPGPDDVDYPVILDGTPSTRVSPLYGGRRETRRIDLPGHDQQPYEGLLRSVGVGEVFRVRQPDFGACSCCNISSPAHQDSRRGTHWAEQRICQ